MKTAALGALLALALLAVPASAAVKAVTITKNGFLPADLTIVTGDSVTWTNTDSVAHQVSFTGNPCSLVIQAGQTGSCSFAQAGTFSYRDPSEKGNFKGSVRAEAPAAVTVSLQASAQVVTYGGSVTLSGAVGTLVNQPVSILAQPLGSSTGVAALGTATSTTGGAYSYTVKPTIQTIYQASSNGGTSGQVKVDVRPALALAVVSAPTATFSVKTVTERALAGRYVDVQRKNSFGQWVTLKRVALKATATPTTAAAKFALKLPRGTSTVRAVLPQAQAGAGYLAATSAARTLKR